MDLLSSVIRLNTIFSQKKWHSDDYNFSDDAFNAICALLNNTNEIQRVLILELLERYQWIMLNDYNTGILSLLTNVLDQLPQRFDKIFFVPVVADGDEGEVKSGHGMVQMIKSFSSRAKALHASKPKYVENIQEFNQNLNEVLVLVDDYVGSGESVVSNVTKLTARGIPLKKIIVVTFAIQERASQVLQSSNIECHTYLTLKKGITDFYSGAELQVKIDAMINIERLIHKLDKALSFGFEKTEALFTLNERTPDNTFPIFWKSHRYQNQDYGPPFPR